MDSSTHGGSAEAEAAADSRPFYVPGLHLPHGGTQAGPWAAGRQPAGLLGAPGAWQLGFAAAQVHWVEGLGTLALAGQWTPRRLGGQALGLGFRRTGDALHARMAVDGAYARSMGPNWRFGLGIGWEQFRFLQAAPQHRLRVQLGLTAQLRPSWSLAAVLQDPHWPKRPSHAGSWDAGSEDRMAPQLALASSHRLGKSMGLSMGLRIDPSVPGMPQSFLHLNKALGGDWAYGLGIGTQPLQAWMGWQRNSPWGLWQALMRWHPVLGWGAGMAWQFQRRQKPHMALKEGLPALKSPEP